MYLPFAGISSLCSLDPASDSDGDGVSDRDESRYGTDADNEDSDEEKQNNGGETKVGSLAQNNAPNYDQVQGKFSSKDQLEL